jgi:hypothetical protein
MPTLVPSQIVRYIDTTLSDLENATPSQGFVALNPATCGALNALLRLIEELPNYLLPSDPIEYAELVQNQESIRFAMKQAENYDFRAYGPLRLTQAGRDKRNQVQIIRAALVGCPERGSTPSQQRVAVHQRRKLQKCIADGPGSGPVRSHPRGMESSNRARGFPSRSTASLGNPAESADSECLFGCGCRRHFAEEDVG